MFLCIIPVACHFFKKEQKNTNQTKMLPWALSDLIGNPLNNCHFYLFRYQEIYSMLISESRNTVQYIKHIVFALSIFIIGDDFRH